MQEIITPNDINFTYKQKVLVVGAGLAGVSAAWFLAQNGIRVVLCESKKIEKNSAQKTSYFAELVCTNSLKSNKRTSAHGILKNEMQRLNSIIIETAYETRVPAGDALAVDRELFSSSITKKLQNHPLIEIKDIEVVNPLDAKKEYLCDFVIISSGPLTSTGLEKWIKENMLEKDDDFYFYDAIAPVVDADSLNFDKLYFKDRGQDEALNADYLNSAMNREQYYKFVSELILAKKVPPREFEDYKFFETCLPVDVMAQRGEDTLRYSCMKPIGLEREGVERPYAVVQLRKENLLGSAYNLVGFQNRLTYSEQIRIFRMIPGLEEAEFLKLGSVHRNSFINSKKLLEISMESKKFKSIYFAGQITGVEGYTESAASGLYVATQILFRLKSNGILQYPKETAIGALINYIMTMERPIPSNINFGLFPDLDLGPKRKMVKKNKKELKGEMIALRAQKVLDDFLIKFI